MKLTALIRVCIFLSLPALILSVASVIITGGYLKEIKELKAANATHREALQEMLIAQNRVVRQAIHEQNRDLAKQIDELILSKKTAQKIKEADR